MISPQGCFSVAKLLVLFELWKISMVFQASAAICPFIYLQEMLHHGLGQTGTHMNTLWLRHPYLSISRHHSHTQIYLSANLTCYFREEPENGEENQMEMLKYPKSYTDSNPSSTTYCTILLPCS